MLGDSGVIRGKHAGSVKGYRKLFFVVRIGGDEGREESEDDGGH
jgi:hypothetical protein